MAWLYLALNGLILAAAALLGWRARRLRIWQFCLCIAGGIFVISVRNFLQAHPEYEQYLLRLSHDYLYFCSWDAPVALFLIFGMLARLQSRRLRRLAVTSFIALGPLFLWNNLSACLEPAYAMPAQFDRDGICRQATDYSCGPAAAVTILKLTGREISEGEMARLCLLRRGAGVTALELCRGLNVALESTDRQAAIRRVGPYGLDGIRTPFLAELKPLRSVEHCVVVLAVRQTEVVVGDPARGRITRTRDEFLREWTGLAITVSPARERHADAGTYDITSR